MKVALLAIAWTAAVPAPQESGAAAPSVQTAVDQTAAASAGGTEDSARVAVLRRDPRSLPRSQENRWCDFGREATRQDDPRPGMRSAAVAVRERDLPRALLLLYEILDSEPEYPPGLYEMGVVYFRLQRYGDAAAVLERFVAVAPATIGQTRVLGHCYYSLGQYARAKAHYERVLAASPHEVEALRGLALSEMHLGDSNKALEHLDEVVRIEPRHAEAWAWKAQVLFDLERSEDALAAAVHARDLDPWLPRSWFLLARIQLDRGQETEGLQAQARYRELSTAAQEVSSIESRLEYLPHQVPLLARLVELHRSTGNVPAAREALARLVRERPTDVDLRIRALDVLEEMGDAEGARIAAQGMRERCAEEWKAWQRLERYYARTGQRLERVQAGERFRRLKAN